MSSNWKKTLLRAGIVAFTAAEVLIDNRQELLELAGLAVMYGMVKVSKTAARAIAAKGETAAVSVVTLTDRGC